MTTSLPTEFEIVDGPPERDLSNLLFHPSFNNREYFVLADGRGEYRDNRFYFSATLIAHVLGPTNLVVIEGTVRSSYLAGAPFMASYDTYKRTGQIKIYLEGGYDARREDRVNYLC